MRRSAGLLAALVLFAFGTVAATGASEQGNIHPKIKLSLSERFRLVTWDNAITLSEDADAALAFTRHRTSLTGQWFATDDLEFAAKFTNECRYYFNPPDRDTDLDEVVFDQLYVKYRNSRYLPGTLTLGRQNMILGEGFLVMDSHPLDGSRAISFNAARFDWNLPPSYTLTLFYSYQPDVDDILPIINDQEMKLVEQPEEGLGAYLNADIGGWNLQPYFILKNIRDTDTRPLESHIYTLGARVKHPWTEKFSTTLEGAFQLGDYGEVDRSAFGGHFHFDYNTSWSRFLPSSLTLGGIYLSGDDPATEDREAWDPLFSRWPKWSESYIYTQITEDGVAYWTNLASVFAGTAFVFPEDVKLTLNYHHLMAPEDPPLTFALGGDGNTRGDLLIAKLTYKLGEYWSGHVLWEYFEPGDYYVESADAYSWARVEFTFRL